MPRFGQTVPVDDYVLDVLMPDLVGHDRQPAAFLVYLYLYRQAGGEGWGGVNCSVRSVADAPGLSKSTVHTAFATLRRRQLIQSRSRYPTATPEHNVLR